MPGFPVVLRETARVLKPGGVLLHVGVHPCFCGGFADWSDRPTVLIKPGYLDGHWTKQSYTDRGVRDKSARRTSRCCTCSPTPACRRAVRGWRPADPDGMAMRARKPA